MATKETLLRIVLITILLPNVILYGVPLVIIKVAGGPNYLHHGSTLPYWGGGIAHSCNKKLGIGLSLGYYSYGAPVRYDTIISTTYSVQEMPVGLSVDYKIFDLPGFAIMAKPEVRLLLSTDDDLYKLCDIIPLEWIEAQIQNRCYLSISPGLGIHYNVPKTNLWLGIDLKFNHHFDYNKEENDYFTVIYSIGFELFRR